MRELTKDEKEKIQYIDTILCALPCEELKRMAEEEEVIAILKDKPIASGIIEGILEDNKFLIDEVHRIEAETIALRSNLGELIRIMDRGVMNSSAQAEFYNLKTRLYIY